MSAFLRILTVLLVLLLSTGVFSVNAENDDTTVGKVKSLVDGIVAFKLRQSEAVSLQEWIDGALTEKAGISSEWYVIALSQYGSFDFSAYCTALTDHIAKSTVSSAVTRQRYALALMAAGGDERHIDSLMENSIGEQGIMSYVCGLHLINNGKESGSATADDIIEKLLSLQSADGGWSLTGKADDADITAMTVQALTPYYESDPNVRNAVDDALSLLSSRQLEDGDFSSYGTPNPESAAQVLTALSGLGIDAAEDERFIKNGKNLLDGLEKYRLTDGSFCHTDGGESNDTATVQAFYSLVSYLRMKDGKDGLYILDSRSPSLSAPETASPSIETVGGGNTISSGQDKTTPQKIGYKLPACIITLGAAGVLCLVLYLTGKRHPKNYIAVLIVTAVAVLFVLFTNFRSAEEYYGGDTVKENIVGTVTITIRCDNVIGKSDSEYIPSDGIILAETEFDIDEDNTVYDILAEAARKHKIQMESSGGEGMRYIAGIGHLYEFDFGDLSGWQYRVNGKSPSVGCDSYNLEAGDRIEWLYTCELGGDLK